MRGGGTVVVSCIVVCQVSKNSGTFLLDTLPFSCETSTLDKRATTRGRDRMTTMRIGGYNPARETEITVADAIMNYNKPVYIEGDGEIVDINTLILRFWRSRILFSEICGNELLVEFQILNEREGQIIVKPCDMDMRLIRAALIQHLMEPEGDPLTILEKIRENWN
jgi:phage tail sheath gpL-like